HDVNLARREARERGSTFLPGQLAPHGRRTNAGFGKCEVHVFGMGNVDAENDGAPAVREVAVGFDQQLVAQWRVHDACELAFHEVAVANLHLVQRQIAIYAPTCDWRKVTAGDHL